MTTLVRFREPLRNFPMNAEFERLMNTAFESPARSAWRGHPRLTSGRLRGAGVRVRHARLPEEKNAVQIEEDTLTVSGSRERAEKVEGERFLRYERLETSRARSP